MSRLRVQLDGVTHTVGGKPYETTCRTKIHVANRSLDEIMGLYASGEGREVDCMACIAIEIEEQSK